jgi:anti-anti-sigma factor
MQIHEEKLGDVLIVTIDDHLDTASAGAFEARLLELIGSGEARILVDCTRLVYVNSAGLKVFLIAAKKLEASPGGRLVLCALAPSVLMIFKMIGFDRIMTIKDSREEALQIFAGEAAPS